MTASSRVLPGLLKNITCCLESDLTSAGFVLSDDEPSDVADGQSQIRLLEYRASIRGRLMILGFCEVRAERLITAELWSPDRLHEMSAELSVGSVADRHLSWLLNGDASPDALISSIVAEVSTWLPSAARPSDGDQMKP
jgi:hypothetical protein